MAQNFWILAIFLGLMKTRLNFFHRGTDGNDKGSLDTFPLRSEGSGKILACQSQLKTTRGQDECGHCKLGKSKYINF